MTMVLGHFSIYTIVDEEPAETGGNLYFVAVICIAEAVIICLAVWFLGRKQ